MELFDNMIILGKTESFPIGCEYSRYVEPVLPHSFQPLPERPMVRDADHCGSQPVIGLHIPHPSLHINIGERPVKLHDMYF